MLVSGAKATSSPTRRTARKGGKNWHMCSILTMHGLAATENAAIQPTKDLPSGIYIVANEICTTW
jgi:hypothetical protein